MGSRSNIIQIYPSLLAANPLCLAQEMERMEQGGVDGFHVDVMDGHYVPNLAFGPATVAAICRTSRLPVHLHLMMDPNPNLLRSYIDCKPVSITVHPESEGNDLSQTLQTIEQAGCQAGLALHPDTPVSHIQDFLPRIQQVLIMSVVPGFAGQSFLPKMLDKVSQLRHIQQHTGAPFAIAIDGGINASTAPLAIAAGAQELISGAYLLQAPHVEQAVQQLRLGVES